MEIVETSGERRVETIGEGRDEWRIGLQSQLRVYFHGFSYERFEWREEMRECGRVEIMVS